jgi:hypothetical protein
MMGDALHSGAERRHFDPMAERFEVALEDEA